MLSTLRNLLARLLETSDSDALRRSLLDQIEQARDAATAERAAHAQELEALGEEFEVLRSMLNATARRADAAESSIAELRALVPEHPQLSEAVLIGLVMSWKLQIEQLSFEPEPIPTNVIQFMR